MKFSNSSSSLEGIAGGSSHNWDSVLCGHKGTESCQVFATSFCAVTKHCFDQCTGPGLGKQARTVGGRQDQGQRVRGPSWAEECHREGSPVGLGVPAVAGYRGHPQRAPGAF